jgi:hypothetical protein
MNKIVLLKLLGCALVLIINNSSYSSEINIDNSKVESDSSVLHSLQTEYFALTTKFGTLVDKCDRYPYVKDIWLLLGMSSPSKAGTTPQLRTLCKECIDWCNTYTTSYAKYHKKEMTQQRKNLLTEIKESCYTLQDFLDRFVQVDAQNSFVHYVTALKEMDNKISEVFMKDSHEQIKLHSVILSALKMNTVFRGDNPRYNFDIEIRNKLTQILQLNQGKFTDGQVKMVNELLKLCNNLNNDVKLYIENTSYF